MWVSLFHDEDDGLPRCKWDNKIIYIFTTEDSFLLKNQTKMNDWDACKEDEEEMYDIQRQ